MHLFKSNKTMPNQTAHYIRKKIMDEVNLSKDK